MIGLRAKAVQKLNKIRAFTSKEGLINKIRSAGKIFWDRIFDIRPRDENDYYVIFGWLVSRRLAMAAAAGFSVFCIVFLWNSKPAALRDRSAFKSYKYNSVFLKFTTGTVKILGKSGYTAYIGDVEDGTVKGRGILYGKNGNIVYEGDFDANAYNGQGKYYYDNSQLAYEGTFRNNLYDGEGTLYRENGTLWYEGNFDQGFMGGEGILYGVSQQKIYSGSFGYNQILYQELLGKNTSEIADKYKGVREIYMGDGVYCVHMKDIEAMYFGADRSNTLEENFVVSGLYVLRNNICQEGKQLETTEGLREIFGTPVYEGNTYLEREDQIALNIMYDLTGDGILYGKAGFQINTVYDDVKEVSGFDRDYQAYIYVYEKEGILYTFFCKDKNNGFDFCRMECV